MNLNPITAYVNLVKHSIIPKPYSHQVRMNILIRKGQTSGTALIPCTIYAMDHSVDLNPSLIRKKTREFIHYVDAHEDYKFVADSKENNYKVDKKKKVIVYNPANYVIELSKDEKARGYELKEYERCDYCGQKTVTAEVAATRYRSCPSIRVKLADPAREDTVVPVQFGFNKTDVWLRGIILPSVFLFAIPWLVFKALTTSNYSFLFGSYVGLLYLPIAVYGSFKLLQWYFTVRKNVVKAYYPKEVSI